jgi:hypothetical protein
MYPWEGRVSLTVRTLKPANFRMKIRIPGWARNEAFVSNLYLFEYPVNEPTKLWVNGEPQVLNMVNGYAVIDRNWKDGDAVILELPMHIRTVTAHPAVKADSGLVSLQRGPVMYCVEQIDQPEENLDEIIINLATHIHYQYEPDLLNGIGVILAHQEASELRYRYIPYFNWANRTQGAMKVWVPYQP